MAHSEKAAIFTSGTYFFTSGLTFPECNSSAPLHRYRHRRDRFEEEEQKYREFVAMMAAYHMEALRKQRVIERKNAARVRIAIAQADQERTRIEHNEWMKRTKHEKEETQSKQREHYLKSMGRTGKTGVINANYTNMLEEQKKIISERDLRHQTKILKDSCLYRGKINEYYFA